LLVQSFLYYIGTEAEFLVNESKIIVCVLIVRRKAQLLGKNEAIKVIAAEAGAV